MDQITIYALGDGAYMAKILNGIAMFPDYALWGSLGAMFAIVVVALRAIMSREFELHWLIISWVLFVVMFNIRVDDVMIVEVNPHLGASGTQNYVVDNVPFGAVFGGAIISNMGMTMAGRMDQVMGDVNGANRLSNGGVGHNLKLLSDIRKLAHPMAMDPQGVLPNFSKSLRTYIQDCTKAGVNNGVIDMAKIYQGADSIKALAYNNSAVMTTYYSKTVPGGETLSCYAAHIKISELTQSDAIVKAVNAAAANLGPKAKSPEGGPLSGTSWLSRPDAAGPEEGVVGDITKAMAAYGAPVADNGRQMVAASMLMNLHIGALMSGGNQSSSDVANIMMVESAAMARNTQAAGEESLFVRYMRPTISFFESWFFAMMPIMAFLIVLGKFGWSMIMKYAMFTLSVALYFPVLAIINLYGNTQMEHYFAAMQNVEVSQSLAGFQMLSMQAQDAVGFTASMVAATPMLVLMILYGTPTVASFLAQRLGGADHISETTVSPNAIDVGSVVKAGAASDYDRNTGVVSAGGLDQQNKWTAKAALGYEQASSLSEKEATQLQYQQQLQRAEEWSKQHGVSWTAGKSGGQTDNANLNNTADNTNTLQNTNAAKDADTNNRQLQQTEAVATQTSVGVNAGTPSSLGGVPIPVGVDGGIRSTNTTTMTEQNTQGQSDSYENSRNNSDGASTGTGNAVTTSFQNAVMGSKLDTASMSEGLKIAESLSRAETNAFSAEMAYSESLKASSGLDMSKSLTTSAFANNVIDEWRDEARTRGVDENTYISQQVDSSLDKMKGMGLDDNFERSYKYLHDINGDARVAGVLGPNGESLDATRSVAAIIETLGTAGMSGSAGNLKAEITADQRDDHSQLWGDYLQRGFGDASKHTPSENNSDANKGVSNGQVDKFGNVADAFKDANISLPKGTVPSFAATTANAEGNIARSGDAISEIKANPGMYTTEQASMQNSGLVQNLRHETQDLKDASGKLTMAERESRTAMLTQSAANFGKAVATGDLLPSEIAQAIQRDNPNIPVLADRHFEGKQGDDQIKTMLSYGISRNAGIPSAEVLAKMDEHAKLFSHADHGNHRGREFATAAVPMTSGLIETTIAKPSYIERDEVRDVPKLLDIPAAKAPVKEDPDAYLYNNPKK